MVRRIRQVRREAREPVPEEALQARRTELAGGSRKRLPLSRGGTDQRRESARPQRRGEKPSASPAGWSAPPRPQDQRPRRPETAPPPPTSENRQSGARRR